MRVHYVILRVELPDNDPKALPVPGMRIRRFMGQAQRWGKLFDATGSWRIVNHWEAEEQVPVAASEAEG
jgi:hypothetical protein